jgi:hypothetical protein
LVVTRRPRTLGCGIHSTPLLAHDCPPLGKGRPGHRVEVRERRLGVSPAAYHRSTVRADAVSCTAVNSSPRDLASAALTSHELSSLGPRGGRSFFRVRASEGADLPVTSDVRRGEGIWTHRRYSTNARRKAAHGDSRKATTVRHVNRHCDRSRNASRPPRSAHSGLEFFLDHNGRGRLAI